MATVPRTTTSILASDNAHVGAGLSLNSTTSCEHYQENEPDPSAGALRRLGIALADGVDLLEGAAVNLRKAGVRELIPAAVNVKLFSDPYFPLCGVREIRGGSLRPV